MAHAMNHTQGTGGPVTVRPLPGLPLTSVTLSTASALKADAQAHVMGTTLQTQVVYESCIEDGVSKHTFSTLSPDTALVSKNSVTLVLLAYCIQWKIQHRKYSPLDSF